MDRQHFLKVSRRDLLKYGGAALLLGGSSAARPRTAFGGQTGNTGCGTSGEKFPTSPLVLTPFVDLLPIPRALAPVPRSVYQTWPSPPAPLNQDSLGHAHQIWPNQIPLVYRIKVQVNEHRITSSRVLPIDEFGNEARHPLTGQFGPRSLPPSTIYGFNGTFPGPMINAEYGRPVLVRFENELHLNPLNRDRNDFGSPEWLSLTHLHNAHTAPESDGNPLYANRHLLQHGYRPQQRVDNLYLNRPAGGDAFEKQSFFWFHDHVMDHTAADVYKGMVGIYPIYDPVLDAGHEATGLRLPGVRTDRADNAFDVAYDIPMVLADFVLDDGVVGHTDEHNGCGESHREWWGQTFYRHYPNKGFVGDIFTVNGVAFPMLEVKRRKYRLRFLDASVARQYSLELMASTSSPVAARGTGRTGVGLQGQYQLPDGQRCMRFTEIATDGGLLEFPIVGDFVRLDPAKRREVVVDFSRYLDGTPTTKGDVIYLVNTLQMTQGRRPDARDEEEFDPNFRVPILKIVIGDLAPDQSVLPTPAVRLRPMPNLPRPFTGLTRRKFILSSNENGSTEERWMINGTPFNPLIPLARVPKGSAELWTFSNEGNWIHPLHIHQEEHRVVSRDGARAPTAGHPEDSGREDTISLAPGEQVVIYRQFRTFTGEYVSHCHNLSHEDHAMMFGWTIE
jgi:FtsP/CotA-like multicopper oxidase with cupredoxin domain